MGRGEYRGLEFIHVRARSLINHVPSAAGLPFENTINPYRGCSHACTYCFARPTHEYLGLDAGRDFENRIVVKVNAVELARAETSPSRWSGASIALGTNTDPYQRAEGKYRLTRGILEVLVERRNPFSILTKNTLVLRDLDLIEEAARVCDVSVAFSIGTLDEKLWRSTSCRETFEHPVVTSSPPSASLFSLLADDSRRIARMSARWFWSCATYRWWPI